ncbi:hypothetical protein JW930_07015 [Candidatus Woesearchaeota archaeon]|nr:hypothetical protein [Candidatus Woesearchaeota archaeon]
MAKYLSIKSPIVGATILVLLLLIIWCMPFMYTWTPPLGSFSAPVLISILFIYKYYHAFWGEDSKRNQKNRIIDINNDNEKVKEKALKIIIGCALVMIILSIIFYSDLIFNIEIGAIRDLVYVLFGLAFISPFFIAAYSGICRKTLPALVASVIFRGRVAFLQGITCLIIGLILAYFLFVR